MPTAGSTARSYPAARSPWEIEWMHRALKTSSVALALFAAAAAPTLADPALDALVAAYPDQLASHDGKDLVWKDGTRMPIADGRTGKSFDDLLNSPDIKDQFAYPYPLGPDVKAPGLNEDPGR